MSRSIVTSMARTANAIFVETWQYRVRTSKPSDAASYGEWADVLAHQTEVTFDREYDPERDTLVRREQCLVRVGDDTDSLVLGDQLKDPGGSTWSIEAVSSSGPGTRQYRLERVNPILSQADTGGTV